jgi:hypothetical protein
VIVRTIFAIIAGKGVVWNGYTDSTIAVVGSTWKTVFAWGGIIDNAAVACIITDIQNARVAVVRARHSLGSEAVVVGFVAGVGTFPTFGARVSRAGADTIGTDISDRAEPFVVTRVGVVDTA